MAVKILKKKGFEPQQRAHSPSRFSWTAGNASKEDIAAEADLIFRATFKEILSLLNRNSDRISSSLSKRKRRSRLYTDHYPALSAEFKGIVRS